MEINSSILSQNRTKQGRLHRAQRCENDCCIPEHTPLWNILIGVGEDENQKGVVRGNQEDDFDTDDKTERHIINIVNRDIGDLWSVNVDPKAVTIDEKRVIKVKVDRSTSPAWCKKNDKLVFYVRQGPTTKPLSDEDAEEYIRSHW